ncbi:MAG TPA: hypothetical protein VGH52_07155 [Gaiellaceae bacterium]
MRRALLLIPLVLLVAACGGKHAATTTTKTTSLPQPGGVLGSSGRTLYDGGDWAVVTAGSKVVVAQLVGGAWKIDAGGRVKISILGPHGAAPSIPQVAVEMKAPTTLVEEGIWVDGKELIEKGGGLKPNDQTIYGAPEAKLAKGTHVVIAYGRTATSGTVVRWTFTVA